MPAVSMSAVAFLPSANPVRQPLFVPVMADQAPFSTGADAFALHDRIDAGSRRERHGNL
ncbi:hypothetical protein [Komagataeibacter europaeus]|uniref:hypothetical protein n=1 Tax=Komagataeibacter europaeus TaxID=33995 RepID=UPI00142DB838|nr:hypothetical protein [Komagataeibacter europaeus]